MPLLLGWTEGTVAIYLCAGKRSGKVEVKKKDLKLSMETGDLFF